MEILFLVGGVILGFIIGYLVSKKNQDTAPSVSIEAFTQSESAKVAAETELKNLRERFMEHKTEAEQLQNRLKTEFENLANRIFEEKSKKFTDQNKSNLDIILNPLKERIKEFEDKVDKSYKAESAERNSLKGEIKALLDASAKISNDAVNLAKALKGDNKAQGNWGELILDKILERSGLTEGLEYKKQYSVAGEAGNRVQPDIVVFLPDNKHLIIDSKVSLTAYTEAVNSMSDDLRTKFISNHIQSLRNHIKGLSEKNYSRAATLSSPDFVLMFLPIESSFSLAVQEDADLWNFAWDRKIVMVSPFTLLATLKTIASLWKQEMQSRNVLEIAEESGKLYDKFVLLLEDFKDIGNRLDGAKKAFENAEKKISEGPGNLVGKVEKLRKLGAKTNKSIPQSLLEKAGDE